MEGNNLDLILGLIENQALLSWNRLEVKGSLFWYRVWQLKEFKDGLDQCCGAGASGAGVRNYLFHKYLLLSVWRMLGWRKTSIETYFLWYLLYYCYSLVQLSGKIWQELELEPKSWTKVEPEQKINNFGSATLVYYRYLCIFNENPDNFHEILNVPA